MLSQDLQTINAALTGMNTRSLSLNLSNHLRYRLSRTGKPLAMLTSEPNFKIRATSSGLHLFNRNTGINILLDEVLVSPTLWATAPRQVSVALTNVCDLACPYCYAPKDRVTLDREAIISWLQELDANGCLGVGFGGGEPTLYRDFVELCQHTAARTRLAVTFTTHGHRIDAPLADKIRGNVHFIRVSMDGVGATYQALRGRSFQALNARLKIIQTAAAFGINYVVNSRTFPDLNRAIDLAAEAGAKEFLLLPEQKVHGIGGIDHTTLQSLNDWVWAYRGPVPLTISQASAHGMPACLPVPGETGLASYAHIDATGTIRESSYAGNGVSIGPGGVMEALHMLETQDREVTR